MSEWETGGTKPRKYYRGTVFGEQVYSQLKSQWMAMTEDMELLLKEEDWNGYGSSWTQDIIDRYIYDVVRRLPTKPAPGY